MPFSTFNIGWRLNELRLFRVNGEGSEAKGGLKYGTSVGEENVADKGKTVEPAVFSQVQKSHDRVQVTRKLQQHSYFKPISWDSKCTKYRNEHAYIPPVPY